MEGFAMENDVIINMLFEVPSIGYEQEGCGDKP